MKIIVLAAPENPDEKRLNNAISESEFLKIRLCRNIRELILLLQKPQGEEVVVILSAGNLEELKIIISMRDLLLYTRNIVILPDKEKETHAIANILHPRFITYADSDFSDLVSVLNKMRDAEKTNAATGYGDCLPPSDHTALKRAEREFAN